MGLVFFHPQGFAIFFGFLWPGCWLSSLWALFIIVDLDAMIQSAWALISIMICSTQSAKSGIVGLKLSTRSPRSLNMVST